jgi:lycopene beta-cyclase
VKHYDYIISGAGAAGLSLLMRLMQHTAFHDKKILVVDKAPKNKNDRTWCFWEKQNGLFEPVVHHKWQQVYFFSEQFSSLLNLSPYQYKMIRGIDFYNYVLTEAEKRPNISFEYGNVETISNQDNKAFVIVNGTPYTADYVFNSIMFGRPAILSNKIYLLQHFKGFVIETDDAVFNPAEATLMDFRVGQNNGTTFAYVLPVANNRALVEYTLFTAHLLDEKEYDIALHNYITSYLNIHNYRITEQEFGIIPMTNMKFTSRIGRVINIGTAGGQTKASSGFTFQFIQKQSQQLVNDLLQYGEPQEHESLLHKRFKFYDTTLLNILHTNKLAGHKVFADLFQKNPTDRVLRFLDNESSFEDELRLMGTLPQGIFMKAAIEEIFK